MFDCLFTNCFICMLHRPKLVTQFLIGLVLGLYLDSAGTGSSVQLLVQIQTAIKNLISF